MQNPVCYICWMNNFRRNHKVWLSKFKLWIYFLQQLSLIAALVRGNTGWPKSRCANVLAYNRAIFDHQYLIFGEWVAATPHSRIQSNIIISSSTSPFYSSNRYTSSEIHDRSFAVCPSTNPNICGSFSCTKKCTRKWNNFRAVCLLYDWPYSTNANWEYQRLNFVVFYKNV